MTEKKFTTEVLVEAPAFLHMVLAASEVFHEETFGLLLGNLGKRAVVEYAIPLQKVKRSMYYAEPQITREKRVREVTKSLGMGIDIIGDFHSHTQIGKDKAIPSPSAEDIATMDEGKIYLILAFNWKKGRLSWKTNYDGTLSGTLWDFHIKIGAYTVYENIVKRVTVICPVATGFFPQRRKR